MIAKILLVARSHFLISVSHWLLLLICFHRTFGKLVYVEENLPLPGVESPPGSPWPLPQSWQKNDSLLTFDPLVFSITSSLKGCDVIDAALHRYHNLVLIDPKGSVDPSLPAIGGLHVSIGGDCDNTPHFDLDPNYESYTLIIAAGDGLAAPYAVIETKTIWGALRGLETFSQLTFLTDDTRYYRINVTTIEDAPRFPHRGLLVDTARHFLSKGLLLKVLDSMSWNKLNVLHWHIVDDQSFPYESRIFPNLTQHGAYTKRHVYRQADIADIVEYARLRGIRVIPEFDTPGHTQGFGKAFPHLLTPCYGDGRTPGTPNYPYHAAYENLDPTNEQVYEFLKAFFVELKHTFVDGYVHLGLDEVFMPCWRSSPKVRAFMTEHNYTEVRQVERHYVERLLELAQNTPLKYIIWQDSADAGVTLAKNAVVQVWKDISLSPNKMLDWREYAHDLTEQGHYVIVSSCWYLNYITYGQDWKDFYNCDPTDFKGTDDQKSLILGGEGSLWGEYVDETNLLPRLWPRASAMAERLWSLPLSKAPPIHDAAHRLDQHRCRMLRRGIPAQPILNGYCGEWEIEEEYPMSTTPAPTTTTTTTQSTTTTSSTTTTTTPPPTTTSTTTTSTTTTEPTTTTSPTTSSQATPVDSDTPSVATSTVVEESETVSEVDETRNDSE